MNDVHRRVHFVTGATVISGAEHSLMAIARSLDLTGMGIPVLVASNPALGEAWRRDVQSDFIPVSAKAGRLIRNWGFVRVLRTLLRTTDAIVLFDYYLLPALLLARFLTPRRRAVTVIDVHDETDSSRLRRLYFWLMPFAVESAICVSGYVARQVSRSLKPAIVHRPIPDRGIRRDSSDSSTVNIGIVGGIAPHKRVAEGVRVVARTTGTRLVIRGRAVPGGEAYLNEVREVARDLLPDRAQFDGHVPASELFDGIDVLLVLNPNEPSGRALAEAQVAGVVVLVPDQGGAPEFVESGLTGFTFRSLHEASSRISDLARDASLRRSVATRAREMALVAYDERAQGTAYAAAIDTARKARLTGPQHTLGETSFSK